ncbi:hypothetical protein [Francisella marina]|uniref:hypothetical protein n=1 Tax=Francisella marina TaxID=2249302 RepID=UPI0011EDCD57|nr:hypothetical protein [Francisella marina]QEO58335.1 hypothetical protein F0R75_00560 [Francisella marina]
MALFGGGGGSGQSQTSTQTETQWVEYYYSSRLVFCEGGLDFITKIIVNDKDLLIDSYNIVNSHTISSQVGSYDLYGSRDREGGFLSDILIKSGHPAQGTDNYFGVNNKLDNSTAGVAIEPAYNYVTSLTFKNAYIGNNSNFGNVIVYGERFYRHTNYASMWYPSKVKCYGGMNPVHIIYELLTQEWSPVRAQWYNINQSNFMDVADRLYSEGIGLSYVITQPKNVQEFIDEICEQADIYLSFDEYTQQYNLTLLRYTNPTGAFEISDTNGYLIEFIESSQSEAGEAVTQVDIEYTNYDRNDNKDIISVFDGGMFAELGRHNITKISYLGVTNANIAYSLGDRELRKLNSAPETITIKATIHADVLNAGDLVIFSFDQLGYVNRGFRVVSKQKRGFIRAKYVTLKLISDLWLDVATIDQTVDPVPVPEKPTDLPARVDNILYYQMATLIGDANARAKDGTEVAFIHQIINSNNSPVYRLDVNDVTLPASYTAGAGFLIDSAISKTDTVISYSDVYNNSRVKANKYAFINDEVIYIQSIDYNNNQITIQRGLLDTYPQEHNAGSYLFATQGNYSVNESYYINDDLDVKLLPIKNGFQLDPADATKNDLILSSRYYKPYPPKNIKINSLDVLTENIEVILVDAVITLASRNRITETGSLFLDYYDGSTAIEEDTENKVVFEFFLSGVSQGTITKTTDTNSITLTQSEVSNDIGTNTFDVIATLSSIRDTVESYQSLSVNFVFDNNSVLDADITIDVFEVLDADIIVSLTEI